MKTLYCALGYACNERCIFCPCSENSVNVPSLSYEDICDAIDRSVAEKGVDNILFSGGEPTIHPDYFRRLEYAARKGVRLSLLTNAIRLASKEFAERMFDIADGKEMDITVAFHSHIPERHDFLTQHPGSFTLSMKGVENMLQHGVKLSIKNNIVHYTYKQLPDYIDWATGIFSDEVTLLLCNIDINGTALKNKEFVSVCFPDSIPYLQRALDKIVELRKQGHKRNVKVLTTPLCLLDPYYWGFVENQTQSDITAYKVPNSDGDRSPLLFNVSSDSGPMFKACENCAVKEYCPGTWRSFRNNYDENILKSICDQ